MDNMQEKIEQIKILITFLRELIAFAQTFFPEAPDLISDSGGNLRYSK